MILVLQGADFSQNNLGQVEVTVQPDDFTLEAIAASGNNSMTAEQISALDKFFKKLGAFGSEANIWAKLDMAMMPILCSDLSYAGVNYANHETNTSFSNTKYQLRNHGIAGLLESPTSWQPAGIGKLSYIVDKTDFSCLTLLTEEVGQLNAPFILAYDGNSHNNRFSHSIGLSGGGDQQINLAYVTPEGAGVTGSASPIGGQDMFKNKLLGLSISSDTTKAVTYNNIADATFKKYSDVGIDTSKTNMYFACNVSQKANTNAMAAIGMIFIGKYLTQEELAIIKEAAETLAVKFNTI